MSRGGALHELRRTGEERARMFRSDDQRVLNSLTEHNGPLVSVAGFAPAFLVRETSVLLLDDTDES